MGFLKSIFTKKSDSDENFRNLNESKRDMIAGVYELATTVVKEVMVPRIDVTFVNIDTEFDDLVNTIVECGYSRFPVFEDTIDNVIGILYVKDLLKYVIQGQSIDLRSILRKPYFVPESKRIDSLLAEFKARRVHIAISVDEYGGTSGIVCLEDIIEEIVGDIMDEFDNEMDEILQLQDNVFLCDSRVSIEDLNKFVKISLPEEEFDTLGGFVFDLFGKIPVKFEKVNYKNIDFIIQKMDNHKISTIKVVVNG
ncbi:MAG: HlyC/CorC family transporter [Spirochaetales bacterium]|nr:HlyC/CorC family transporter [Spirochaetales bacterium]